MSRPVQAGSRPEQAVDVENWGSGKWNNLFKWAQGSLFDPNTYV